MSLASPVACNPGTPDLLVWQMCEPWGLLFTDIFVNFVTDIQAYLGIRESYVSKMIANKAVDI
jgi:hypothetical protein